MENFYTDNPDIRFCLDRCDLGEIARLYEGDFSESRRYPHAPENEEDAVDNYHRVLELVGEISAGFIAPRATEVDREGAHYDNGVVSYPQGIREDLEVLTRAGLMGFTLPRRYGGLNMPRVIYAAAIEMVSRADASLMTLFGLQDIAETILDFADDWMKDKYLPMFASGEVTGAMVLTEPDAGSDLQAVQLHAEEDPSTPGLWRLNGVKRFITNGCADVLLVLGRSEPGTKDGRGLSLFLCEKGEGVWIRRIEDKLGIHGSPTCEIQFNNAPAYLVGKRRRGLTRYVMSLMNGARIGIAAQGLGVSEAAYAEAVEFALTRKQFGKCIVDMPPVADILANMKVTIEASRALLYDACRYVDIERRLNARKEEGETLSEEERRLLKHARELASILTPMSKYYNCEAAVRLSSDSLQIHGGSGYMRDYDIERIFRDSRITPIYEGTSQLQVVAVLAGLLGGALDARLEEFAAMEFEDGELKRLHREVMEVQSVLKDAVEHTRRQDDDYRDLAGRQLTDLACDVYIAHLLLDQARYSSRKRAVAARFVRDMHKRFETSLESLEELKLLAGLA